MDQITTLNAMIDYIADNPESFCCKDICIKSKEARVINNAFLISGPYRSNGKIDVNFRKRDKNGEKKKLKKILQNAKVGQTFVTANRKSKVSIWQVEKNPSKNL